MATTLNPIDQALRQFGQKSTGQLANVLNTLFAKQQQKINDLERIRQKQAKRLESMEARVSALDQKVLVMKKNIKLKTV